MSLLCAMIQWVDTADMFVRQVLFTSDKCLLVLISKATSCTSYVLHLALITGYQVHYVCGITVSVMLYFVCISSDYRHEGIRYFSHTTAYAACTATFKAATVPQPCGLCFKRIADETWGDNIGNSLRLFRYVSYPFTQNN